MKQISVGSTTIDRVLELQDLAVSPTWLLVNIADAYPDVRQFEVNIQAFLVRTPDNNILVDPCCGNGRARHGQTQFENLDTPFLDRLKALGVEPEAVDLVLMTHLHFDHVGWNTFWDGQAWRPTFPNARYVMLRAEYEFWLAAQANGAGSAATRASFVDSVAPVVAAGQAVLLESLEDMKTYDDNVQLRALSGHTPFQFGISVRDDENEVLLVADALHSPLQIDKPWLRNGGDVDPAEALKTRLALIEYCLQSQATLLASHFAHTSAGRIVSGENGPSFIFEAP